MGIDVEELRIESQIEHIRGMAPVIEHVAERQTHCVAQQPVAHATAIHEPELLIRLSARGGRKRDPAAQTHRARDAAQRHRPRQKFSAEHRIEARLLARGVDRGRVKHTALTVPQPKADVEAREREALHPAHDAAELGGFAAHEFAPRRHVEEEVADLDAGARRMRRRPHGAHSAAVDAHFRGAILRAARARQQAQARHRGDRGQRLATKSQCRDRGKIGERCDLAGRVARERNGKFLRAHANAVVAHANEADAAALDVDVDAVRVRIQGVFDEFLDDRGGTLDHFPGSNLIDEFVGENPDRHDDTLTDISAASVQGLRAGWGSPEQPGRVRAAVAQSAFREAGSPRRRCARR